MQLLKTIDRKESEERVLHPTSGKKLEYPIKTKLIRKLPYSDKTTKEYESVYAVPASTSKELKQFRFELRKKLKDLSLKHSKEYGKADIVHLLTVVEEKHEDGPYVRLVLRTYIPRLDKIENFSKNDWTKVFEEELSSYHNKAKKEVEQLINERKKSFQNAFKELLKKLLRKYPKIH